MTPLLLLFLASQDLPDHPDKLRYPALQFSVPDPAAMRSTLKGGTTVYALEDPGLPLVHLQFHFRRGSFDEPTGKAGLAQLWAEVLRTGGTKSLKPQQLDE